MVCIVLVIIIWGLRSIVSRNDQFISSDSINYYIDYVDNNSKENLQLNWKEVAAIDGLTNVDFKNINTKKIENICLSFYENAGEQFSIKSFDKVLDEEGFSDKEKKRAKTNLVKLNGVSLRTIRDGKNKEKDEFINELKNISIANYREHGILPSVTISQAILESNWGNSKLSSKYNNYFGIKASADWKGNSVSFSTGENYNDVIDANFRTYNSLKESVEDFGNFLSVNDRYTKNGLFDSRNYIEQTQALENAGYSTKKNEEGEAIYADLLIDLIRENNLMIIDTEAARSN